TSAILIVLGLSCLVSSNVRTPRPWISRIGWSYEGMGHGLQHQGWVHGLMTKHIASTHMLAHSAVRGEWARGMDYGLCVSEATPSKAGHIFGGEGHGQVIRAQGKLQPHINHSSGWLPFLDRCSPFVSVLILPQFVLLPIT
ncbi:hypothetical protein CVT26_005318, partial [Gymnopilus dilepis]